MTPSRSGFKLPGAKDDDKAEPTHDAISAWLLREVQKPGAAQTSLTPV